jgi:putative peptidoglycan binding protein
MASTLLKKGSQGPDVVELKRLLQEWGKKHPLPKPIAATPVFGVATELAVRAFQEAEGLDVDGKVGTDTWGALAKLAGAGKQIPPLPGSFSHPMIPPYVTGTGWQGLQPWIVPQVRAICAHFGLQVTAGFGGHPPHAEHSDHGWGGGVDLAGPMDAMVACNLWADKLCSDPHKPGMVFRWVGGPAKDSTGVEPGHENHVHLSWYRDGPATTIFGTPEFP